MYVCVRIHACMCAWAHTRVLRACMHVHMSASTCTYVRMYCHNVYICMYVCDQLYIHTYVRVYLLYVCFLCMVLPNHATPPSTGCGTGDSGHLPGASLPRRVQLDGYPTGHI